VSADDASSDRARSDRTRDRARDDLPSVPTALVDRREAFRRRCLALAVGHGPVTERYVAERFMTGRDATTDTRHLGTDTPRAQPSTASPDPRRLLLVPGLLGDAVRALVAPFACSRDALSIDGRDIQVAWVNGRAGCTRNAARLRTVVLEQAAAAGAAIDLVGYSKGCPDALHMLSDWPDTHAAVRSLTSLGGVVHGTPLATEAPRIVSRVLRWLPLPAPMTSFGPGDGRAIADLTPAFRQRWFDAHALPDTIRYASIVASPSRQHISRVLRGSWRALSDIDPLNDSQVIASDAMLPRGELLATVDADHWALALPIAERSRLLARFVVTRNDFPRRVMLEALMDHLALPSAD